MIRAINKLRLTTVLVTIVELLLILLLTLVYFLNPVELASYFTIESIVIVSSVLMVFNNALFFFITLRINGIRKRNAYEYVGLLGGDIKEAYSYGGIGIVVVDKYFNVIWASELFQDRKISIIDQNILTWKQELSILVEFSEMSAASRIETIKIEAESRNYEVKYLPKSGIFMFKDTTEFEFLFETSQKNAPVLGVLLIDNYSDISVKGEIISSAYSTANSEIIEYFTSYGALVRPFREDAYLIILNKITFDKINKDQFSLLETVKEKTKNMSQQISLSMGFAYNISDYAKLHESALNAIDTAMARGGDQVVLAPHGEEFKFIGGASSQAEKRYKTAVRLYADTMFRYIREANNVIIMTHTDTDLDAMGASLGLKAMADYVKKNQKSKKDSFIPTRIVYDPNGTEEKTKLAVQKMFSKQEMAEIFITPEDVEDQKGANSLINSRTLLIVADVSRPMLTVHPKLLERASQIIIIDHHRRTDDFIDQRVYDYIETSASSTCEMVTELIYYGNTPNFTLNEKYATFMLSGIYLDTNNFRTKTTGSRTFLASMALEEWGADVMIADDFLKDNVEEYALINKIMGSMETISLGIVLLQTDEDDIVTPETLSKVANQSMRIKGILAAFVIGKTEPNKIKISGRSNGDINVQFLLEKIGGGGHQASAAAVIVDKPLEEVAQLVRDTINTHLNSARVTPGKKDK